MSRKWDFSGWATKANIRCSDGRTILPNAFSGCDGMTVPLVWNHQHNDPSEVLGHALLENRKDGVYAYCSFNDNAKGREAKELVKHGDIKALSIYANQLVQSSKVPPCDVVHGMIREVSLVLAGANVGAYIDNVLAHGEVDDSEAEIYHGDFDDDFILYHADEDNDDDEDEEEMSSGKVQKTSSMILLLNRKLPLVYFLMKSCLMPIRMMTMMRRTILRMMMKKKISTKKTLRMKKMTRMMK